MGTLRYAFSVVVLLAVSVYSHADEIVVGSFNVEWFGHGFKPRDSEQVSKLANFIKSLEVDLLACQEIHPTGDKTGDGVADWDNLLAELGDQYDGKVANVSGAQRLAFIWRKDRLELSDVGELRDVDRQEVPGSTSMTFPRRPATAYVTTKDGGLDFRIVTVHLHFTANEARYAEATQLNTWVRGHLASAHDKDLIIIGDCNTKSLGAEGDDDSETMTKFVADDALVWVSQGHAEFTTPTSEQRYDHALLSKNLHDGEFEEGSWDVRREVPDTFPDEYLRDISNHVPVVVRLRYNADDDADPAGDLADDVD